MKQLEKISQICLKAINDCFQAEKKLRNTQEEIQRQKKFAESKTKQQHEDLQKQVEQSQRQFILLHQTGDQIMEKLALRGKKPAAFSLPAQLSIDKLMHMLQKQYNTAQKSIDQLEKVAQELLEERKKWWKFW